MTSKEIYNRYSEARGFDITKKNRLQKFIYSRAAANALCRQFTKDSYSEIGSNAGLTHATVIFSVRKWYETYQREATEDRDIYLRLFKKLTQINTEAAEAAQEDAPIVNYDNFNLVRLTKKLEEERANVESLKMQIELQEQQTEAKNAALNPLVDMVNMIPPEKVDMARVRMEPMIKMLLSATFV
jgi:hypothetical protein